MVSRRYNFRLQPGRDDELIRWLDSLGAGERSHYIRQALRRGGSIQPGARQLPVNREPQPEGEEPETEEINMEEAESKVNSLMDSF